MSLFDRLKKKTEDKPYDLTAPVEGTAVEIKEVKDKAFASEEMGKGVGIKVEKGKTEVYAPISGEISVLFPTLHAIGITTEKGIEVLIHIGVDTVNLGGKGFRAHVKQGEKVRRGDILLSVQFDELEQEGYDMTLMMIVSNTEEYEKVQCNTGKCDLTKEVVNIIQ